jgi:hypothetical protein
VAKILETLEQAVCGALGTKSVEVVGSQLSIAVSAADEMVSDDDQPPGYGNESFLAAGTSSNAVEQSAQIRPFATGGGPGRFTQCSSNMRITVASSGALPLPCALASAGTQPGPTGQMVCIGFWRAYKMMSVVRRCPPNDIRKQRFHRSIHVWRSCRNTK